MRGVGVTVMGRWTVVGLRDDAGAVVGIVATLPGARAAGALLGPRVGEYAPFVRAVAAATAQEAAEKAVRDEVEPVLPRVPVSACSSCQPGDARAELRDVVGHDMPGHTIVNALHRHDITSFAALRAASEEQVAEIPGIGPKALARLKELMRD